MRTLPCVQNNFMQGQSEDSQHSFDQQRMTDLDLALLQDSGWFDVKYGSTGVSAQLCCAHAYVNTFPETVSMAPNCSQLHVNMMYMHIVVSWSSVLTTFFPRVQVCMAIMLAAPLATLMTQGCWQVAKAAVLSVHLTWNQNAPRV
jgi:hypothetical protein